MYGGPDRRAGAGSLMYYHAHTELCFLLLGCVNGALLGILFDEWLFNLLDLFGTLSWSCPWKWLR